MDHSENFLVLIYLENSPIASVLTADRADAAGLPQAKNPLPKTNKKSAFPNFCTEACLLLLNWETTPQASVSGGWFL